MLVQLKIVWNLQSAKTMTFSYLLALRVMLGNIAKHIWQKMLFWISTKYSLNALLWFRLLTIVESKYLI